jgi:hypothetical protein
VTPDQLASLAQSLKDNEAFQAALDNMRANALDGLAGVNADDKNAILKFQATVNVVDDLRGNLDQFIRSGKEPKKPGIA